MCEGSFVGSGFWVLGSAISTRSVLGSGFQDLTLKSWILGSEFYDLYQIGSGFWVLRFDSQILDLDFEFWVLVSEIYNRSVLVWFQFINGIPAILQGFPVSIMAKGLLKKSPVFFEAGGRFSAKCLVKESQVIFQHYVLL